MSTILGLDLGTNSIGWALVDKHQENTKGKILGMGSRIIPMSQDVLGKFDSGVSISQTAERTGYRGIRRLLERNHLRRERLHRVLNILGFLPKHYGESIDFENHFGKFLNETEPKLAFKIDETGKYQFQFMSAFNEMVKDFNSSGHRDLKITHDWTIYYLRKKALSQKIEKEELAWLLLNFNQKRGYYQLRGEEIEEDKTKLEEFYTLKVVDIVEREKGKSGIWYNVILENGWVYKRESKTPLDNWIGKEREFIVTTELNDDGTIKLNKENEEKRSFRSPKDDDWGLVKIRTEQSINNSGKTVGAFIYDSLKQNPTQKIRGKLVRTIERRFYKNELVQILRTQLKFHPELSNRDLFEQCINDLYKQNEAHKNSIRSRGFDYLFIDDIIFYQRPLKSKISLISDCNLEFRPMKDKKGDLVKDENGKQVMKALKCIAKSHPLFQEYRLWQFIENIKIFKKESPNDLDVTSEFLENDEDKVKLFETLNDRKEIEQKQFLGIYKLKEDKYRWNYVEDKAYPCNETRALMLSKVSKLEDFDIEFFNQQNTEALWHILYSVSDKIELESAVAKFANRHHLSDTFAKAFSNIPPFKNDYGSLSSKAIKKLLPLMRKGKYWSEDAIDKKTRERIEYILTGEYNETIKNRVREKAFNLSTIEDFKGLPLWLSSYIIYDKHSESSDIEKWNSATEMESFIKKFKQHSLRNPIVEQVITETLRVVKDIWLNFGEGKENFFDEIHIELGREMKNPADKRKQITERVTQNENTNLRIKAILEELKSGGMNEVKPYSPSQQEILKIYEEGVYLGEKGKEQLDEIDKIRKSNKPTSAEIQRYKLWLEQGYVSPYTGAVIKLSDLFTTKYEIEHIFPQSRFFDDSLNNKVICESEVNQRKENQTAMEFIKNHHGEKVPLNGGGYVTIREVAEYELQIKDYFSKNKTKLNNLLSEDIPEKFIERQLNDSRYISKEVKKYLSKIVRAQKDGELETEATSKNVISTNGSITSKMKQDWGLNDVWNTIITPRFERMNALTNSNNFGQWEIKKGHEGGEGKRVFQISVPDEVTKGFSKKRIDHRHHALDALVIACVTRDHINYINSINTERTNYGLVSKLRRVEEIGIKGKNRNVAKEFHKPWDTFTVDAKNQLEQIVVSFKQNTRVINKTVNKYQKYVAGEKTLVEQTKGESWAIRKPMHKETVSGKVQLQRIKKSPISIISVLEDLNQVADKNIKNLLKERLRSVDGNVSNLKKELKNKPIEIEGKAIEKVTVFEEMSAYATRKALDISFDEKKIEKITDTGIQKILLNYLKIKGDDPEKAFTQEGIEEMNLNISNYNNGKQHQPILKVRIWEEGSKFRVGFSGNKKDKYVEAASGTNLYFAIYLNEEGKRSYDTIPLNIVIERLKQGLSPVPEKENHQLLFWLSPNDLVYVPNEIILTSSHDYTDLDKSGIYKCVSFTGNRLYGIPFSSSKVIYDKIEYSQLNKMETTTEKISLKEFCWKLEVDRLGNIIKIIK